MPKYRKGYLCVNIIKEILRLNKGNIEIKVLKNNKKAYKLYNILFNRYIKDGQIHTVIEDGDEFRYYNFNIKNLTEKL